MPDEVLKGRAILVVEDEYMIAMDLKRELVRAGAVIIGPAPSLDKAIALIESAPHIDVAILDVSLHGEMVFVAADLLQGRGVPFVFATGYDERVIPRRFDGVVRCEKPMDPEKIRQSLEPLVTARAQG